MIPLNVRRLISSLFDNNIALLSNASKKEDIQVNWTILQSLKTMQEELIAWCSNQSNSKIVIRTMHLNNNTTDIEISFNAINTYNEEHCKNLRVTILPTWNGFIAEHMFSHGNTKLLYKYPY